MFVWHDFWNWPFGYYFTQIGVTGHRLRRDADRHGAGAAALLLRRPQHHARRGAGTLALLMRRLFDVLRGIDMAIWG